VDRRSLVSGQRKGEGYKEDSSAGQTLRNESGTFLPSEFYEFNR